MQVRSQPDPASLNKADVAVGTLSSAGANEMPAQYRRKRQPRRMEAHLSG